MRRLVLLLLPVAFGLSFSGFANAAPQVLLVVSPQEEIPMTCEDGRCTVEVTAICLQPDRANPERGTHYVTLDSDTVRLVGTTRDGRTLTLPVTKTMEIMAEREHTAVTLSVQQSILATYQVSDLTVRLKGNVVLAPKTGPDDTNPQSSVEIALAKTKLRKTAEAVIAQQGERVGGAGLVRMAINNLPRERAPTAAERMAAERKVLTTPASATAVSHARDAFDNCRSIGDTFVKRRYENWFGYRNCLAIHHDELIEEVNREYWEALKTGY